MSSVMGGINRTNSLTYLISVREDRRNAQVGAALNNRMGQVAASTNRVKNNARGAALATRNLGYVAQNASYQIADFFVMLQGGVGVGRALATQLPQLLAGFGALGAVFGAIAAIGASVVVMLTNQKRSAFEATEALERLAETTSSLNDANAAFVKSGTAATKYLQDYAFYQQQISSAKLAEVFAPPEPSAWRGIVAVLKEIWGVIKQLPEAFYQFVRAIAVALKDVPVIGPLVAAVADDMQRLREELQSFGQAKNAKRDEIFDQFSELARDIDNSYIAAKNLNNQLGNLTIEPPILEPVALSKVEFIFDVYKKALIEAGENVETLSGKEADLYEILKNQVEVQEKLRLAYKSRLQDLISLEPLKRMTDLEAATAEWSRALDQGIINSKEYEDAIKGLTEIDRWEDLQDAVIDLGKTFESRIVDAMKTGKFAVADFVTYALEQFARIALSRVLEPFFLLLANAIPGLGKGGTGSTSPGVGGGGPRSMAFEIPPSAAPMYNYGESIGRVPGGTRNVSQSQQANNVTVNVNNYGNDEVEVSQSNTSNGIEIDVLIKNTVRKGLSGGDFDSVMAQSFGARRLGY